MKRKAHARTKSSTLRDESRSEDCEKGQKAEPQEPGRTCDQFFLCAVAPPKTRRAVARLERPPDLGLGCNQD
jgi:hypothetical protein